MSDRAITLEQEEEPDKPCGSCTNCQRKRQNPTALFRPDRRSYKQLVKTADKSLKKLKVPSSIDRMKISRCDLTGNGLFSSQKELMEYLRIFKRSALIPRYRHVFFSKDDQKATDWRTANAHSHCLSCYARPLRTEEQAPATIETYLPSVRSFAVCQSITGRFCIEKRP